MINKKMLKFIFISFSILLIFIFFFLSGCKANIMEIIESLDMDSAIEKEDTNLYDEGDMHSTENSGNEEATDLQAIPKKEINFENPVKTPHYVDNVPAHSEIIPAVPLNVVVNFNFDIVLPSEITIMDESLQIYSVGETIIDENKLGMRVKMQNDAPEGLYTVEYKACWPDGSCHEGMFQFAIDKTIASDFSDLRGQSNVVINMKNQKFEPQDIIINKGTIVTWTNQENIEHYVNTDPHPGHNYFFEQNSAVLYLGDSFSLQFNNPGYYPYHCSVHPETMRAIIIVE